MMMMMMMMMTMMMMTMMMTMMMMMMEMMTMMMRTTTTMMMDEEIVTCEVQNGERKLSSGLKWITKKNGLSAMMNVIMRDEVWRFESGRDRQVRWWEGGETSRTKTRAGTSSRRKGERDKRGE
eukprot:349243-Hanusia_phi.AAC.2